MNCINPENKNINHMVSDWNGTGWKNYLIDKVMNILVT